MNQYNLGCCINHGHGMTKTAVIDHKSQITYQELDILSNQVARSLAQQGITIGDRVSVEMANGIDLIATQLGILKLGAVAVLINPDLPDYQKNRMLALTQPIRHICDMSWLDPSADIEFAAHEPDSKDPALIIFTSGTTADPKPVLIAHGHRQDVMAKVSKVKHIVQQQTILSASPQTQGSGCFQIYFCLLGHATLITQARFQAQEFLDLIVRYAVTYIIATPTVLHLLLKQPDLDQFNLDTVTSIVSASAPLSSRLLSSIRQKFIMACVSNIYGNSEAGPGLFYRPANTTIPDLSVGREHDHISYRLNAGILEVRHEHMMLGYDNNQDNFTQDGYYVTNDLFEKDADGWYYYVGRADNMFTCGGTNVYPSQIESVLEKHPAVWQAVVVGIADEIKGHKPYAFVVADPEANETILQQHVCEYLPRSHCPRKIWILPALPINISSNKTDRSKLIDLAQQYLK